MPPPPLAAPPEVWAAQRSPREADPAPVRLLLLALVAGIALDLGLRGGFANLAVAVGLGAVIVGLLTDRRLHQRTARFLAAAALVPVAFLVLRVSPWLVATNLAAISVLVAAALAFSRSGRPTDTTLGRLVHRVLATIPAGLSAPRTLAPLVPRVSADRSARLGRVVVALAVCVPVLVVVAALLAAADPVFAGMLSPDVDAGPAIGHVIVALVLALGAVCVIGMAASDTTDHAPRGQFGTTEVVTILSLTAVVLGLFVVSQLVALTSAGQRLIEEAGLTPAEYARSGFFQLCWATGLILSLLAATRALAGPDVLRGRAARFLGALVPCLALGLVAVSLRRMALYDDAFGLTMLRLWVLGAAVWMGVVLLLVAARNAGAGGRREWVLAASAAVALALVLVANTVNPEAQVARHNLDRAAQGAELDPWYLAQLSDDASPVIADAWDNGNPSQREVLEPALRCGDTATGVQDLNLSVHRGEDLRSTRCEGIDG